MRDDIMRLAERVESIFSDVPLSRMEQETKAIADDLRAIARTDHVEDKLGMVPAGWRVDVTTSQGMEPAYTIISPCGSRYSPGPGGVAYDFLKAIATHPAPDHSAGVGGRVPQVNVGTIGHVSRDKTTLTAALVKVAKVEAQRKVGTVADISDEDLLRRAMSNLFPRSLRVPAWSRVSDLFGLGSTYSWQLCVRFGRDPETGKPAALAQLADADSIGITAAIVGEVVEIGDDESGQPEIDI